MWRLMLRINMVDYQKHASWWSGGAEISPPLGPVSKLNEHCCGQYSIISHFIQTVNHDQYYFQDILHSDVHTQLSAQQPSTQSAV